MSDQVCQICNKKTSICLCGFEQWNAQNYSQHLDNLFPFKHSDDSVVHDPSAPEVEEYKVATTRSTSINFKVLTNDFDQLTQTLKQKVETPEGAAVARWIKKGVGKTPIIAMRKAQDG